jgi:hypothetical protein
MEKTFPGIEVVGESTHHAGCVETLTLALFHEWRPSAWFMILTAYLDGSGTEPSAPVCTVAGYLGTADKWKSFDLEWNAMLAEFEIEYYHAVDLHHGKQQFENWPREKRDNLRNWAKSITGRHAICGFSSVLKRADYDKVFKAAPEGPSKKIHNEFSLCFLGCLEAVCRTLSNFVTDKENSITFVLESGDPGKGYIVNFFDRYKYDLLPHLSGLLHTISFANKKTCQGVQAADYLAHWVHKEEKLEAPWSESYFPPPVFLRIPLELDVLESVRDELDKIDMHVPSRKRTKL